MMKIFPRLIIAGILSLAACQRPVVPPRHTPLPTPEAQRESPSSSRTSPPLTSESLPAQAVLIGCEITQAVVDDPKPPLNVRSTPRVMADNVVGTLENGQFISVLREDQGWLEISDPIRGWVAKNRTQSACNLKQARLELFVGQPPLVIRDRFIGTGTHRYTLAANAGQHLQIQVQGDSPFPLVFAPNDPDGRVNLAHARESPTSPTSQRIPLPVTGDYLLILDSNFKGYNYEMAIALEPD